MPVTFVTFGFCYLAIIGIPPFSGFFAKDGVIDAAFETGGTSGWVLGLASLIGAGITAFYMTRVMFMTFGGERRWDEGVHPHEVPPVMTSPMVLLAIGAIGFGAFEVLNDRLADFLGPVVGFVPEGPAVFSVAGDVALVLVIAAIVLAWAMYGRRPVAVTAPHGSPLTVAARKELYGNTVNEALLMRPGQWLTRLSVYFDNRGVDGLVNTVAATVGGTSGRVRRVQTGFVRSYALSMFVGAVLLVGALLLVRI
jgi:NADH-quinone oxidoreductase subunit L